MWSILYYITYHIKYCYGILLVKLHMTYPLDAPTRVGSVWEDQPYSENWEPATGCYCNGKHCCVTREGPALGKGMLRGSLGFDKDLVKNFRVFWEVKLGSGYSLMGISKQLRCPISSLQFRPLLWASKSAPLRKFRKRSKWASVLLFKFAKLQASWLLSDNTESTSEWTPQWAELHRFGPH